MNTPKAFRKTLTLPVLWAILMASFSVGAPAVAQQNSILSGKQALYAAANNHNAQQLLASFAYYTKIVEAASTKADKLLAHYYSGYAQYRLINTVSNSAEQQAQHLDSAIKHLEDCTELDPSFAEGFVLLSSCYGRKAGGGMMNGMKYGPKSNAAMETALKLSPNNPRAFMVSGISLYFRPAMWGGDKKKAVELWQRAAQIFDATEKKASNPTTTTPDWGHEEIYAWLGTALADEGNIDGARAAYDRALEITPNYSWVKYVLLPKLANSTR